MSYNGYENYETWNVSLWIQNVETFYQIARFCEDYDEFVDAMVRLGIPHTGDSVSWKDSKLCLEHLNEIIQEI